MSLLFAPASDNGQERTRITAPEYIQAVLSDLSIRFNQVLPVSNQLIQQFALPNVQNKAQKRKRAVDITKQMPPFHKRLKSVAGAYTNVTNSDPISSVNPSVLSFDSRGMSPYTEGVEYICIGKTLELRLRI